MSNYNETFFIVPSYILDLPNITLGYLKVYETIFQFWNKGRACFLSNPVIQERTGLGSTQVKDALSFFETHGELIRFSKAGKRYLARPEQKIEYMCSDNEQVAAPAAGGSRSSGHEVAAPAAHNIKKVNKENKDISDFEKSQATTGGKTATAKPLKPQVNKDEIVQEIVSVYHEELPDSPRIKKIGSRTSELYRLLLKLIKNWSEYSASNSEFSIEAFRQYLKFIKENHYGFLQPYTTKEGNIRKNNLKTLIREDNILRFINDEFNFNKGNKNEY